MKVIYNSIIPFRGFVAINLFGIVFVRKEYKDNLTARTLRHEAIHTEQMKELLYVGFYIIYFLEWIVRLVIDYKTAYRSISFEQEAYWGEGFIDYAENRKKFGMWRKGKYPWNM